MSFSPSGTQERCVICSQRVYPMDRMAADSKIFHKNCMKCEECKKVLSLGNYASLADKYYCKPHFKQLFALKGNYSEGFGEAKPTAKWANKDIFGGDLPEGGAPVESAASAEATPAAEAPKAEEKHEEAPQAEEKNEEAPQAEPEEEKHEEPKEEPKEEAKEEAEPEPEPVPLSQRMAAFSVAEAAPASPAPSSPSAAGRSPKVGGKSEKCHICEKTVYPMERMAADGVVFHKNCMKCEECKKTLGLGNYASLNGKYYCKPHFKQLFALKGNYSEGFGEEKPTAKWTKPVDTAPCAAANQKADDQ